MNNTSLSYSSHDAGKSCKTTISSLVMLISPIKSLIKDIIELLGSNKTCARLSLIYDGLKPSIFGLLPYK